MGKRVVFGDPKIKPKRVNKAKLLKKLKKQLWDLAKEYCRKKWGNTCYTCGKKSLKGSDWHTCHFIPSALCWFELDYSPANLRPGCYHCNINLGGNGSAFYDRLLRDEGQDYINGIFKMKNQTKIIKPSISDYEEYIEKYKSWIEDLNIEECKI